MPHIDFKITTWYRIPFEKAETLDKLIAHIKSGKITGSSGAYDFIDEWEGHARWEEIDSGSQEDMSPSENGECATIEVYETDHQIRLYNGMKPNDDRFCVHGTYTVSNAGGYEIQLSDDGESARVRDAYGGEYTEISDWIKLKSKKVSGEWINIIPVDDDLDIPLNQVLINREHFNNG